MQVLDVERLAEVFDHDSAEIAEVVQLLITTATDFVAGIEAALERRDHEEGARLAHELKGAAGNAGAEVLSERSRAVELFFKDRDWQAVRWAIADLRAGLDVLRFETAELRIAYAR
jgi:HPt (histidine-containing phosphotransfer) domain-containing protein